MSQSCGRKACVVVNCRGQLRWAMGYPDMRSNILGVSVSMFLDETNS